MIHRETLCSLSLSLWEGIGNAWMQFVKFFRSHAWGFPLQLQEGFLFLCGKKWQGSLERKSEVSQVKAWVSRTTSDSWGILFRPTGWIACTSLYAETDRIWFWILRDFCFVSCFKVRWGNSVLMLKKRADVQEGRTLFTELLRIFIQGLWQLFKPGQLF